MPLSSATFIVIPQLPDPPPDNPFTFAVPIPPVSRWMTAISAGGLIISDATDDVVIKPYNATDSTRVALIRPESLSGTTLRVRLVYEGEDTPPEVPPRIRVFAKGYTSEPWTPIRNALGDLSVTIPTDSVNDAWDADEIRRYTSPDNHAHAWDCDGNVVSLILVENTYDTENAEDAVLEANIV